MCFCCTVLKSQCKSMHNLQALKKKTDRRQIWGTLGVRGYFVTHLGFLPSPEIPVVRGGLSFFFCWEDSVKEKKNLKHTSTDPPRPPSPKAFIRDSCPPVFPSGTLSWIPLNRWQRRTIASHGEVGRSPLFVQPEKHASLELAGSNVKLFR